MAEAEKKIRYQRALMGLREKILTGALSAGDRVSEVALANDLGVSRTPLREAMSELIEQGFLERMSAGGCRVAGFTRDDVVDSIELRGAMEGVVFRRAAERGADPEGIARCQAVIDRIDGLLGPTIEHCDFQAYMDCNEVLHGLLADLCGSPVLIAELRRICNRPMAGPSAFVQSQAMSLETLRSLFVAQDQHKGILEAIRRREGARAEALAREHARLAQRNLDLILASGADLAATLPVLSLVQDDTDPQKNNKAN